jgi:hypothetical protein
MKDMVENDSSGGGPSLPPGESHDEFLELCALATTEWLSVEERRRLDEHLARCLDCREALRQYQALVANGIPDAAFHAAPDDGQGSDPAWSIDEAEASLFARLDRERGHEGVREAGREPGRNRAAPAHSADWKAAAPPAPLAPLARSASSPDALWRHMWWQFAAGLVLAAALGFSVYLTGIRRGAEMARLTAPPVATRADSVGARTAEAAASAEQQEAADLRRRNAELAVLRNRIAKQSARLAHLGAERAGIEGSLGRAEADQRSLEQARDDLAQQLAAAQAEVRQVRQQLEMDAAHDAADDIRVAALRRQVGELNAGAQQMDQELAREEELLDHDRDIRQLMSSRNLYIAEVYDVARNGRTQKPFGRVFYTKGKSLIFYAYDLDQQPGLRESSTFQAWGRRGPDEAHAVSLGIFYVDRAAQRCWVLKADNPKALADIDAVFVTVEPPGGSSHPSSKPLLFAYLRIEPNHP